MPDQTPPNQVVFTNKAQCRDCYRCLRVCPVKAIRIHNGQAVVEASRCISCGTCIRECPQGAKSFRNDLECATRLLSEGGGVAASVAPSFVAVFSEWERRRLPSALRKLGFSYVGETAIGAFPVARETAAVAAARGSQPTICTACPACVSYVERYQPEMVDLLAPVVSPMLAHAKHIKDKLGANTKVIFIGPCVAKKAEADRPENAGLVDCVITFAELAQWLEREGISLSALEESAFDEEPEGDARLFPIEGGSVRTADLSTDLLARDVVSVSGFEEFKQALDNAASSDAPILIEPLFCPQGCINGPAITCDDNVYERRRDVLSYSEENQGREPGPETPADLTARFSDQRVDRGEQPSEEAIRSVLEKTGKSKPEDQLNCGACGYPSCRDKAIAVLRGMAEAEMCIPYMRRLAEQRTDKIIESSPNGIVILDERLNIIHMNPAFRRFFMCSEAVLGKKISYLMDPDPWERLAAGDEELIETTVRHERYNLVTHEILYPMREERQYVGIFVNITNSQANERQLGELRQQTVKQARELLEHQIRMAQQMAQALGESTAQGERLVDNLLHLAGEDANTPREDGSGLPWDTSTSK
jgi:PAS domain S-box-containing protein